MERDTIVIRKYANRRLYDTSNSRYINLEDIAALVRNGKNVQVLDAATGEDITRVTLTQIIVEDAKGQPSGLPLELLKQLIVTTDHVGQEFILWYLKSAFDTYQKVQSSVQNRLSQMQSAALSPLQMMRHLMESSGGADKRSETSEEIAELRRRLAELEAPRKEPKTPVRKKAATRKRRK